jgi:hypothetical protein
LCVTAETLTVATLQQTELPIGIGIVPPAGAQGQQIFVRNISMPNDGTMAWNAYQGPLGWQYTDAGAAAMFGWDATNGWDFSYAASGSANQAVPWQDLFQIWNNGNAQLFYGTLTVARDAQNPNEVVTLQQVMQIIGRFLIPGTWDDALWDQGIWGNGIGPGPGLAAVWDTAVWDTNSWS